MRDFETISDEVAAQARELWESGLTHRAVATKLGVPLKVIRSRQAREQWQRAKPMKKARVINFDDLAQKLKEPAKAWAEFRKTESDEAGKAAAMAREALVRELISDEKSPSTIRALVEAYKTMIESGLKLAGHAVEDSNTAVDELMQARINKVLEKVGGGPMTLSEADEVVTKVEKTLQAHAADTA